jgi:hypothetical protein
MHSLSCFNLCERFYKQLIFRVRLACCGPVVFIISLNGLVTELEPATT